ncbi:MAG: single-stranded-DNA-specific exonuclease RecJ [Candidatus Berkelbacteria bacterium]|nr:single-stranded-DNA-specific exonuclease RecJ [Candidatus Berkelbacteria bacterium]
MRNAAKPTNTNDDTTIYVLMLRGMIHQPPSQAFSLTFTLYHTFFIMSMHKKTWEVKPKKYDDVILQLLYNRGIIGEVVDEEKIQKFLNPNFETDFHNPKLLPDFGKAIDRLKIAVEKKEKVGIFADYDADGIPGAALLYKTFFALGIKPEIFIPTRSDGYGFNESGIDYLIDRGCKIIISVDLGIRDFSGANYIKSKKIDLIITDHHLPDEKLPKALAVVNPKIKSSKYPFSDLAGGGVAYKIVQGLAEIYPKILTEKFLKWNLDLPAISTMTDVVPLKGENRLIAKFGLKVLAKSRNAGIAEICRRAGIDLSKLNSYSVGFQIGPRINAPGRIDQATGSFEILISGDEKEVAKLATELEEKNLTRQNSMEKIFQEASRKIDKENLIKNKIIILANPKWPKGVIGPVASRLVEKYLRPVILFKEESESFSGSVRSINGFNIVEVLESIKKYLLSFGGHAGAAGIRVTKKNYHTFYDKIILFAKRVISDEMLQPKLKIDLELSSNKISVNQFKEIEKLEPFGMGNPRPVFLTPDLILRSHRFVGKENKHLQLRFFDGKKEIKGIVFSHEKDSVELNAGEKYDIVYTTSLNFWNGKWWPDVQIMDLKISN